MLTKDDNDIVTRVGPGTVMGNLLRRYWTPACLSSEIPEPDCTPVRVTSRNSRKSYLSRIAGCPPLKPDWPPAEITIEA